MIIIHFWKIFKKFRKITRIYLKNSFLLLFCNMITNIISYHYFNSFTIISIHLLFYYYVFTIIYCLLHSNIVFSTMTYLLIQNKNFDNIYSLLPKFSMFINVKYKHFNKSYIHCEVLFLYARKKDNRMLSLYSSNVYVYSFYIF